MTDTLTALLAAAAAWIDQDPDAATRHELEQLAAEARAGSPTATNELTDRFAGRLEFGTAGLRGPLGAGPNRMNRVLVAQAAAGLAAFLLARDPHPSIVIGYDARKNSTVFATDTAEIMRGAGVHTTLLPRPLPTPVLAFAVRKRDATAGVMVTASHNPAADNGYKVYLGGPDAGSQIIPPNDELIARRIAEAARGDIRELPRARDYAIADESLLDDYVRATASVRDATPAASPLRFVYTALHGVGWETAARVFRDAGFDTPIVVAQQIDPDPEFPTVAYPNPEEVGALDLAFTEAVASGADLVIAHDPDADRLAVGIPTATGWKRLGGNEIGWLLGWRAAERSGGGGGGSLACSLVSSPALRMVAQDYGLEHVETLTGFKWISRAPGLIFGYEEALGYLVDPEVVRDKDGISAAVAILDLATALRAEGKTLADQLDAFAARFGAHASTQFSLRFATNDDTPRVMDTLRRHPPTEIAGMPVSAVDDFAGGLDGFRTADILRLWLEDGSRIIVRPSGTEPKLKIYIDVCRAEGSLTDRLSSARSAVNALETDMRRRLGNIAA